MIDNGEAPGVRGTSVRRGSPGRIVVLGIGLVVLLAAAAVTAAAWSTFAWSAEIEAQQQLLPGTRVAGVDVGDLAAEEAVAAARPGLDEQLDRTILVTAEDRSWRVVPRALGVHDDLDAQVDAAAERARSTGVTDLARIRWLGSTSELDLDVSFTADPDAIERWVDAVGDEVDLVPTPATIGWEDGTVTVAADVRGRELDREHARQVLATALVGDDAEVELAVAELVADVTEDDARAVAATAQERLDAQLDRSVTLVRGGESWSTTPRQLGAVPDVAALAPLLEPGTDPATADLPIELEREAVAGFVAEVAAVVDVAAVDAQVSYDTGWVEITDGRDGLAVDRETVTDRAVAALLGDGGSVEVTASAVAPSVTRASFGQILLVRQSERMLYLYENGEIVREWPVAVGTGGQPTPTGLFTVGAKRFEPTWVNPAPDRWGADLPERIGPGPDNPLGLRALNWNRNGADTLIRFHGTPNEDSIGQAASNGCVRMFNTDVIELYDRVSTGTTIVSVG